MRRRTDGMKNREVAHNTGKRKYPRALRRVESVCQILVKMQEQMIFLLAALTAGISCLTAIISSATGYGPSHVKVSKSGRSLLHNLSISRKGERQAKQQLTPFEGRVPQRLNTEDHEDLEEPFDVSSESSTNVRTEDCKETEENTKQKARYEQGQRRCNESTDVKSRRTDAMKEDFKETEQNTRHGHEGEKYDAMPMGGEPSAVFEDKTNQHKDDLKNVA